MSNKPYLYILAGTWKEFLDEQYKHPEFEVINIVDENTLRGRSKGKILRIGSFYERHNIQPIEESIEIAQNGWGTIATSNEEIKNVEDYGIE